VQPHFKRLATQRETRSRCPPSVAIEDRANIYAYVGENPLTSIDPLGLYLALVVTLPDGSYYFPMTTVKNPKQTLPSAYGEPQGTPVPIAVPEGVNPQNLINYFSGHPGYVEFGAYWGMGVVFPNSSSANPKGLYKNPKFDAFGNFEFGATGAAAGIGCSTLTRAATAVHFGNQSPINTHDIQTGFNAVAAGGKVGVLDTEIFGGGR
jgi:hypothetical protein